MVASSSSATYHVDAPARTGCSSICSTMKGVHPLAHALSSRLTTRHSHEVNFLSSAVSQPFKGMQPFATSDTQFAEQAQFTPQRNILASRNQHICRARFQIKGYDYACGKRTAAEGECHF